MTTLRRKSFVLKNLKLRACLELWTMTMPQESRLNYVHLICEAYGQRYNYQMTCTHYYPLSHKSNFKVSSLSTMAFTHYYIMLYDSHMKYFQIHSHMNLPNQNSLMN